MIGKIPTQENLALRILDNIIKDKFPEPVYSRINNYLGTSDLNTTVNAGLELSSYLIGSIDKTGVSHGNFWKWLLPYPTDLERSARELRSYNKDMLYNILFVTRFLSRFTPKQTPSAYESFWDNNERLRNQVAKNPLSPPMLELKKVFSNAIAHGDRSLLDGRTLPSGAVFDPKLNTQLDKLIDVITYCESEVPDDLVVAYKQEHYSGRRCIKHPFRQWNRPKSVPKKLNTGRFIAMEPTENNWIATGIQDFLISCLPCYCNIHDQERNRELARRGSIDGSLATIDLHAASDSLSLHLMQYVMPHWLYNRIMGCTSRGAYQKSIGFGLDHKIKPYALLCTMGNRVTFPLETLLFSSIVEVARHYHPITYPNSMFAVYGDDIIVPADIAETVVSLLEYYGFIVNNEKTFIEPDSRYRESCGSEWYEGYDLSTKRWPRHYIDTEDRVNCFNGLIDLQHKLYDLPYTDSYIRRQLYKLYPGITESYPESQYDDIWAIVPNIRTKPQLEDGSRPEMEIHTTIVSKSPKCTQCEHWRLCEEYHYQKALSSSPSYYDETCRLLGITERPFSRTTFCSKPSYQIKNKLY